MSCGIYKIINLINNKLYIGSSSDIEGRWREHKRDLSLDQHHSRYLQRAVNKYRIKSFSFEIIEICQESSLLNREQFYLDLYQSYNSEFGYNICKIAGRTTGLKLTKEQLQRHSEIRKGKSYHSEYQLQRLREVHTGKKPCSYIIEKRRRVLQISITGEVIREFKSLTEASIETKINNIGNVLNGNQLKSGGYYWRYLDETEEDRSKLNKKRELVKENKIKGRIKAARTNCIPVIQIDRDTDEVVQEFSCSDEASMFLGSKDYSGSIQAVCRGEQKTAYNFKWRYKRKIKEIGV